MFLNNKNHYYSRWRNEVISVNLSAKWPRWVNWELALTAHIWGSEVPFVCIFAIVYVHDMWRCAWAVKHVWSQDNLEKSVFSFHFYVTSGAWTQAAWSAQQALLSAELALYSVLFIWLLVLLSALLRLSSQIKSHAEACPFLNRDGRGADREGNKWERGGDGRRIGRGNWLACKKHFKKGLFKLKRKWNSKG